MRQKHCAKAQELGSLVELTSERTQALSHSVRSFAVGSGVRCGEVARALDERGSASADKKKGAERAA